MLHHVPDRPRAVRPSVPVVPALAFAVSVALASGLLIGCETAPVAADASSESDAVLATAATPAPNEAVLWVNGMGCPLCANNVDEQLAKVPGVEDVRINLGTGSVVARLSPSAPPTEAQLAAAVDRTGFTLVRIDMPR